MWFEFGLHHTKGVKNGTTSSLADARIKRGCARKGKAGKYLLKILLCRRISCELMLSILYFIISLEYKHPSVSNNHAYIACRHI